jgi:hypothetical protein
VARFPFGIAKSWYPIAYSEELACGEALRIACCGDELCATRDDAGIARARGSDGRAWPIHEGAGVVSVWYHAAARPPEFTLPDIEAWGDPAWASSWQKFHWRVHTHPQEMRENAIDWAHFRHVHGGSDRPTENRCSFDGPRMQFSIESRQPTVIVRSEVVGLGWSVTTVRGPFEAVTLTALTPVDRETTDVRSAFLVKRAADARAIHALVDEHARGIEQDIAIWERKVYRAAPMLCDGDGPIAEFRAWAAQFYCESGVNV